MADKVRDRRERGWSWFHNEVIRTYGAEIGPFGIAVYMALLTFADATEHTCYPSHQQISDVTGMSKRQVGYAVEALMKAKLITKRVRQFGTSHMSNLYTLLTPRGIAPPAIPTQEVLGGIAPPARGVWQEVLGGIAGGANEQDSLNKTQLNKTHLTTTPLPPLGEGVGDFQIFWEHYPRKTGKGEAQKRWDRLNPSPELLATILAAIAQQKTSAQWTKNNGQFVPSPAKWLNQQRWEDEPPVQVVNGVDMAEYRKRNHEQDVRDEAEAEERKRRHADER